MNSKTKTEIEGQQNSKAETEIKCQKDLKTETEIERQQESKAGFMVIGKMAFLLVVAGLLLTFFWYENHHIVVSEYEYRYNERLQFAGDLEQTGSIRIVQLSDFHNAMFGKKNSRLIDTISAIEPDIIVITGDIVDSNHTNVDIALELVDKISQICDVYYVTGNHEDLLSVDEQEKLFGGLKQAGTVILDNQSIAVNRNGLSINLIGIGDANLNGNTLENVIATIDNDNLTVLLAHEPQLLEKYARNNVDIVFSGHAHGGQFRIPGVGGLVAPDQGFFPKLTEGKHVKGNTTMYISRGLGNSIIPVRLFNDPEIVCVEIK